MLDDAVKALNQMLSPRLRAVLWKSIGLALALIIAVGIALDRLIVWLVGAGGRSVETTLGPQAHLPATALGWLISIAAGLGIVVGSVMLMPAVTAVVASFFADQIAEEVERAILTAVPEVESVRTHLEPIAEAAAAREVAVDADVVERVVREETGAAPRELRFVRTDDGIVVFMTVAVEGGGSLASAHDRASAVEKRVRTALPGISDVVVHTEP